jgi:hypothetical protein
MVTSASIVPQYGYVSGCTDTLLAIVDWQTVHAGNPMEDVCRLLISSFPSSLRREHSHRLIDYFYTRCEHYYKEKLPFSVDKLHRAYAFAFPFAMWFYASTVAMMMHNEHIIGTGDVKERRQEELYIRARDAIEDTLKCRSVVEDVIAKLKD